MEAGHRKILRRINLALFIGAAVAAGVEVLFLLFSRGSSLSGAFFVGVLTSFLITFSCLFSAARLGVALLCLFTEPDEIIAGGTFLGRWVSTLWKAPSDNSVKMEGTARFLKYVFGVIPTSGLLFGVAYWVLSTFHEPVRMAVLIAIVGALLVRPLWGLSDAAVSALLRNQQGRLHLVNRVTAVAGASLPVTAVVLVILFSEPLFGAVSPFPLIVLVSFVSAVATAAFLGLRTDRGISGGRGLSIAGGAFLLGLLLLTAVPDSRGAPADCGALSRWIYAFTVRVLDADGDGFAWLIGGDCHPLDGKSGPFGVEIPGNGYDEDCDGSDTAPEIQTYVDPLDRREPSSKRLIRPKGNVLLIISDATAAGHLAVYGAKRDPMPHVTRFAKQAVLFEHFFAVSNHTSVAVPSILTGRYPSVFPNIRDRGWNSFNIPKKNKPVQQILKTKGYKTYMAAGHNLVSFLRGFDKIDSGKGKRMSASALADVALKALKKIGPNPKQPTLVAVHFIDPHHPYRAPDKPTRFGTSAKDRYDGELAYVDRALSKILKRVQSETYRDWLIIFTSDHGEAFYEHGTANHGFGLYDEEVRVPLLMRVPGLDGRRVTLPASQVDLLPTILEWAGLPRDKSLPGRSLLGVSASPESYDGKQRFVFSEFFRTGGVFGAYNGRLSLIYKQKQNSFELYDRQMDPVQKKNIYDGGRSTLIEGALKQHVRESLQRLE